jgi:hypothetical protein
MTEKLQLRKVQAYRDQKRSILIVLPRTYVERLKIEGGDYLKMLLDNDKLVLQKANL